MKDSIAAALPIAASVVLLVAPVAAGQQSPPTQNQKPSAAPTAAAQTTAVEEWRDDFDGEKLDETKWESYTFEGGGGKLQVKDNQLKMRGAGGSRSGVRSKKSFRAVRFYVEGVLAKVEGQLPQPGQESYQPGLAIVTVLFDGNSNNRLEWILRSDGLFEAWAMLDGKSERLDNRKLGTKEKNARLGIARRDDQIYFMLNQQVGLERRIPGLSADFKVMLYGFGSSQNDWDSVSVQTTKQ